MSVDNFAVPNAVTVATAAAVGLIGYYYMSKGLTKLEAIVDLNQQTKILSVNIVFF